MSAASIIGDWGGSRLRLWRREAGKVVGRRDGPGILQAGDPTAALGEVLAGWEPSSLLLCGMAGARGGFLEAPYAPCPVSPDDWLSMAARTRLGDWDVTIAAGASCRAGDGRPDVMRGEETQIFGAMAIDPTLARGRRCVVMPGTHSKWATLDDGRITGFRTFMTGELFGLLQQSSLMGAACSDDEAVEGGFRDGLERSRDGIALTTALFEARSRQLCDGAGSAWAKGFVSGLLIGAEIREMTPPGPVLVIGEPQLAGSYRAALSDSGLEAFILDGEDCAIAGLELLDGA